jgi:hypothetical protein
MGQGQETRCMQTKYRPVPLMSAEGHVRVDPLGGQLARDGF